MKFESCLELTDEEFEVLREADDKMIESFYQMRKGLKTSDNLMIHMMFMNATNFALLTNKCPKCFASLLENFFLLYLERFKKMKENITIN